MKCNHRIATTESEEELMTSTEKYEKPALSTTPLEMDCAFMSVSKVDLETESGNKSVTKDFDDINKQYIIY
mgnify:CR=1 FL=1